MIDLLLLIVLTPYRFKTAGILTKILVIASTIIHKIYK